MKTSRRPSLWFSPSLNLLRILHSDGSVEALDMDTGNRSFWFRSIFSGPTYEEAFKELERADLEFVSFI